MASSEGRPDIYVTTSDGRQVPRHKFYTGSSKYNAWVNDLHWKMAIEDEKKFRVQSKVDDNLKIWRERQMKATLPPQNNASKAVAASLLAQSQKVSKEERSRKRSARRAKASANRLGNCVRRSTRVRDVVKSCIEDDLASMQKQLKDAINGRKKSNERLQKLCDMIVDMRESQEKQ